MKAPIPVGDKASLPLSLPSGNAPALHDGDITLVH